eukprot:GEMP01064976.1.p1 GENE.GEMP01064976.1~~GEMP01064976.1.p1  ORF type:complete len:313 (+),score=68.39 GEMP01064976.1:145-1083(+)
MREPMLIAGGYGPEINFYAVDTAECIRSIHFPKGHVNKLVISPDREFLAAAGNPCVRIYPIEGTPGTGTAYEEHTGNVTAVGFGSDNKWFFTAGEDGFIKLWDRREEGRKLPAFYEGSSPIHCCILHPNQAELIFGDHQGRVMIWDIVANKIRQSIEPREASSAVRSVTISSDGRLLVAATDTWNRGTCHAWKHDGAAWQEAYEIDAHNTYVLSCRFSPLGSHAVQQFCTTSADTTVNLWELRSDGFARTQTLLGHSKWVWDCAYTADGAYVATGSSDGTCRVWDCRTGETHLEFAQPKNGKGVTAIALLDY